MQRVGELVKEGFARIKGSSLKKLVKKVERQEIEYYEQVRSSTLVITDDILYDHDSDELTSDEELDNDQDIGVAIDGGAESDLEEEDNNPISDCDE